MLIQNELEIMQQNLTQFDMPTVCHANHGRRIQVEASCATTKRNETVVTALYI
jgi:hypothetical protein